MLNDQSRNHSLTHSPLDCPLHVNKLTLVNRLLNGLPWFHYKMVYHQENMRAIEAKRVNLFPQNICLHRKQVTNETKHNIFS